MYYKTPVTRALAENAANLFWNSFEGVICDIFPSPFVLSQHLVPFPFVSARSVFHVLAGLRSMGATAYG